MKLLNGQDRARQVRIDFPAWVSGTISGQMSEAQSETQGPASAVADSRPPDIVDEHRAATIEAGFRHIEAVEGQYLTDRVSTAIRVGLGTLLSVPDHGHWRERMSCVDVDPETFFSNDEFSKASARTICVQCPVRRECLLQTVKDGDYGQEDVEAGGIWAGLAPIARLRVAQVAEEHFNL